MSAIPTSQAFLAHRRADDIAVVDDWCEMIRRQLVFSRPGWRVTVTPGRDSFASWEAAGRGSMDEWASFVGGGVAADGRPVFDEYILPVPLRVADSRIIAQDLVLGRATASLARAAMRQGKPVYLWGCRVEGSRVYLLNFVEVTAIIDLPGMNRKWAEWAVARVGVGGKDMPAIEVFALPTQPDLVALYVVEAREQVRPAVPQRPGRKIAPVDVEALVRLEADEAARRAAAAAAAEAAARKRKEQEQRDIRMMQEREAARKAKAEAEIAAAFADRVPTRAASNAPVTAIPRPVRSPAPPQEDLPAWREFTRDASLLLDTIVDMRRRFPRGEKFFVGVAEKVESMRAWAEDNNRVTPRMIEALDNIEGAVEKWRR